jgi:hypothetical protein
LPEAPDDAVVYAAGSWQTNALLIAEVAKLGYLRRSDRILDPTYGRGTWWRVWRPNPLDGGDLVCRDRKDDANWDFRRMYDSDGVFDAVAFDPPYVSVGGRATSGIKGLHDAYGMAGTPTTPRGVQDDIDAGLGECFRVVRAGGVVLCKVQSYVSSGKLWPGLFLTYNAAVDVGFVLIDHFVHVAGPRPQPSGRRQIHAHRNQSDLLVLQRPKRRGSI